MKSVVRSIKGRRGRPAGEGRHRRGHPLPRPTWTSQSPPFPAPAASSPPPSCSGLARGLVTWSPAWSSGSHESLLPSQHPQGQGRLLASGTAWLGEGQSSLLVPAATPFLSPQKYVLASPSSHFWDPEVGSELLQLQHPSTSPHDWSFLGSGKLQLSRLPTPTQAIWASFGCKRMSQEDFWPPLVSISKSAALEPP